ncbi:MAG: hypothetical protein QM676_07670 [Novosphingobium sp.]
MNAPSKRLSPLGGWPQDSGLRPGPAPRRSDPESTAAFEAWFFEAMVALTLADPRERESPNPRKRESDAD